MHEQTYLDLQLLVPEYNLLFTKDRISEFRVKWFDSLFDVSMAGRLIAFRST